MQVALLDVRVSAFHLEVDLLPAIADPTHIPSLVRLKLVLDLVWTSRVYFADQPLHNWQRVLLVLFLSEA